MTSAISSCGILASCGDYVRVMSEKGIIAAAAQRAAERAATGPILAFDLTVVTAAIAAFLFLKRFAPRLWLRAMVMAAGIFLFELFTSPMWHNEHLGRWAYVYCDVSWVLTLGWTTLLCAVVISIDRWLSHWSQPRRFAAYLGILLVLTTAAEIAVVALGIRRYSQEVLDAVSGISLLGVPLEILYYVPVFNSLVIAFYKYWNLVIDDVALVPVKKRKWLRAVILAFIAVFFFELMVEPVVTNTKFPAWSYIYRDISVLYTGWRVLLIAVGAVAIDRFMIGMSIPLRFAAAVLFISFLALPVESWFITHGYRIYGETAVMNYSGFKTPLTGAPVEIAFAIPCYMSLIVGFIRFWEIVFDNRL
jgi:hypothetical protein